MEPPDFSSAQMNTMDLGPHVRAMGLGSEEPAYEVDIPGYELRKHLSSSRVFHVYHMYDQTNERDVIVKLRRKDLNLDDPDILQDSTNFILKELETSYLDDFKDRLLRRDVEVMRRLDHPAVPEVYDMVETDDYVFSVVQPVDGQDLLTMVNEAQNHHLSETAVLGWALQLCDLLDYMHSQQPEPLILRGLKPSKIMVDQAGQAFVIDFDITEPPGQNLPKVGTSGYSPPEQYVGHSDVRSDVYALGATLYHLLASDPRATPFLFHVQPPRLFNQRLSPKLEEVILKAVAHEAKHRFEDIAAMKRALLACR